MSDFFYAEFGGSDSGNLTDYVCDIGGPITAPSIDPGDIVSTVQGLNKTDVDAGFMRLQNSISGEHVFGITTVPPQKNYYAEAKLALDPTATFLYLWIIMRATAMAGTPWPHAINQWGAQYRFVGDGTIEIKRDYSSDSFTGEDIVQVIRGYAPGMQTFKCRVEVEDLKRRIYFNDMLIDSDVIADPNFDHAGAIYFYVQDSGNSDLSPATILPAPFDYWKAGTALVGGELTGLFWEHFVKSHEVDT